MTATPEPIIAEAIAASCRVLGREDPGFVYELLARQILGADECISIGYIRAGQPSGRAPKLRRRAVDEISV